MNIKDRNISVWGDSILKGIVRDEKTDGYKVYPLNCVKRFEEETGSCITNHASFGMTTNKAFQRIERSLKRNPPKDTDIVLIEFGGNDCDYIWSEISEDPERYHEPKTTVTQFTENLQGIFDTFISWNISPIVMTLPPLEPNRYFEWISRGLNKMNILKWLGDKNKIYRWQEVYNTTIVALARKNNLRLIDVRKNFLLSKNYEALICDDGIHPNEKGHELIYATFMDFLLS